MHQSQSPAARGINQAHCRKRSRVIIDRVRSRDKTNSTKIMHSAERGMNNQPRLMPFLFRFFERRARALCDGSCYYVGLITRPENCPPRNEMKGPSAFEQCPPRASSVSARNLYSDEYYMSVDRNPSGY